MAVLLATPAGVYLPLPLEAGTVTDSIALDAGDNNEG